MQRFNWETRRRGALPRKRRRREHHEAEAPKPNDTTEAIRVNATKGWVVEVADPEALPCDVLGRQVRPGDTVVHRDEESARKRVVRVDAHRIWTDDGLSAASRAYRRVEAIKCSSCGAEWRGALGAEWGNVTAVGRTVCHACFQAKTRLERVLLGWEADPYRAHRERISHGWKTESGWQPGIENPGDCWGMFEDNPQPSMSSGLNGSLGSPPVPDLGRRCFPPDDCFGETEHRHQNDHAPKPLPVDDPSGDDVAADAPGAAEYMGVRNA